MQTSQKINSEFSNPFLDYIPAELKANKDWIIISQKRYEKS